MEEERWRENSEKFPLTQKDKSRNSISILKNLVGTPTKKEPNVFPKWRTFRKSLQKNIHIGSLSSEASPKRKKRLSFFDKTQRMGI
ncbi:hypothetical protein DLM75_15635 [Leptospira stimsonii]|uniref:Uncharacterized protein n=1 Tax=Leptospira stimsonii TaxID=2202203 RepID=A0A396Z169_9LEPT|nr:hypothetical protein DLM75_15635 [Leptospira stimsonii]